MTLLLQPGIMDKLEQSQHQDGRGGAATHVTTADESDRRTSPGSRFHIVLEVCSEGDWSIFIYRQLKYVGLVCFSGLFQFFKKKIEVTLVNCLLLVIVCVLKHKLRCPNILLCLRQTGRFVLLYISMSACLSGPDKMDAVIQAWKCVVVGCFHVKEGTVLVCRPPVRVRMRSSCVLAPVLLMLLAVHLITAEPDSGTVIPAESKMFINRLSFSYYPDCLHSCVHDERSIDTTEPAAPALPHDMETEHALQAFFILYTIKISVDYSYPTQHCFNLFSHTGTSPCHRVHLMYFYDVSFTWKGTCIVILNFTYLKRTYMSLH